MEKNYIYICSASPGEGKEAENLSQCVLQDMQGLWLYVKSLEMPPSSLTLTFVLHALHQVLSTQHMSLTPHNESARQVL